MFRVIHKPTVPAIILAAAVVAFGAAPSDARAEAASVGSWSPAGTLPRGSSPEMSAVTLADGRVLALDESHGLQIYDPASNTWTLVSEASNPWTAVALAQGALLVGEAQCSNSEMSCRPTTSAYRLSPNGAELTSAAPMHEARVHPALVRLNSGEVLAAGGFGPECPTTFAHGYSCTPIASAELYDPQTNEWSPTGSMPQPRGGASATLLSDGTVLVVGGNNARGAIRYDPASGAWTAAGETAIERVGALLLPLPGNHALAVGSQPEAAFFGSLGGAGERAKPECRPLTAEIYSAASNAWAVGPQPAGSEHCLYSRGALLTGGQILLGSVTEANGPSSPYQVLDTERQCWSTTTPPIAPRIYGTVAALTDGRALVIGGADTKQWLSSAEIYTPGVSICPAAAPTAGAPSPSTIAPPSSPRFTGATIVRRKRLTITVAGAIQLLVRCPAGATGRCVGGVRATLLRATPSAKGHRGHMLLGDAAISLAPNTIRWVTVHLTKHKRTLQSFIRRWHHATIMLTATTHDGTGQTATTTTSEIVREPTKASAARSPWGGSRKRLSSTDLPVD